MDGATFDWTFDQAFHPQEEWYIDGVPIPSVTDERATNRAVTLIVRADTQTLLDHLRACKPNQDQVDVLTTDSGGFSAVDRADGGNTFELQPPTARQPLRQKGAYHVRRYEETLVSAEVDEWDVELEFVRASNRSDSQTSNEGGTGATFVWTFDQAFGPAAWVFDTPHGELVTDRVDAEFLGTGADGVERFEVVARLTFDQSLTFESAFAKLDGVRVRSIPDGSNLAVDDTAGNQNTVSVTSPTTAVVETGDYVVVGWEARRLNDAFTEYSVEIARSA